MLGSFWQLRHHSNVHLLWYEDMVMDMVGNIRNMATFLGYNLTREQVGKVEEFVDFNNYKEHCQLGNKAGWNEGEGHFVRKGKVGDWMNYMQEDMGEEWDTWARMELGKLGIEQNNVSKIFGLN